MWQAYRVFKTRRAAEPGCTLFAVWRAYACFQRKWKALRTASRQERRQWITQQIRTAHDAAQRHDMGEVYRIVRLLAPKQKRDPVRIRDKEGHLLDKRQQFEAIFHYFSAAFRRAEAFQHSHCLGSLDTQLDDVVKSIKALKPRKAVPADTPPAEVWQLCPETAAAFFVRVLDHACTESRRLPARMSDCSLLLLPKPGKTSRLPTDLRPLGLQDPSSKVLASALKSKIQAIVLPWLSSHKQFAYCSGKAIDEAISRASGHCRQVRELLQNSQVSVHARRQGKQAQQCCGGVTLSIDLSRAFDQLPRWGLVASLRHAQVPEPLINLVVVVHENCIYRVKHGAYSGDFPLQVGVRQGCTLAPLLFSIFTCWLSDQLDAKLGFAWSHRHHTAFADDNLAQWIIRSAADLGHMCTHIRALFQVLQKAGMSINVLKSGLLLRLQGTVAKTWIRQHSRITREGVLVNVGTPAIPIEIPKSSVLTYLGIQLSYGSLEMQTCAFRMRAAQLVRQRLIKVLHTQGLRTRVRLQLHSACVRSSMIYGQHAVGITNATLRKMEAADARFVRAITRCPVHLTRVSNMQLYHRHKLKGISQLLVELLKGRVNKSLDVDAVADFSAQLESLRLLVREADAANAHGIQQVEVGKLIPCRTCGQYFACMQHLLSHQGRKHPELHGSRQPKFSGKEYAAQTVDGMPVCVHCRSTFTRVEALKKHLARSCPVLYARTSALSQPECRPSALTSDCRKQHTHSLVDHCGLEVKVASTPAGLLGPAGRTPTSTVQPEVKPLIEDASFRQMVLANWKGVFRVAKFRQSLSQYCVLCGQWADMSGLKQHIRLVHGAQYALQPEASARVSSLGLTVLSPCHYCGKHRKEPRAHMKHCASLFQASLASLVCREDLRGHDNGGDGRCGSNHGGSGDDGGAGLGPAENAASRGDPRQTGARGQKGVGPQKWARPPQKGQGGKGTQAWDPLALLFQGLGADGRPGPGGLAGHGHAEPSARLGANGAPARGGAVEASDRHVGHLLHRHGPDRDPPSRETGRGGVGGATQHDAGKVRSPLKVILLLSILQETSTRISAILQDEGKLQKALEWEWIQTGHQALEPNWIYFQWNPAEKRQEKSSLPPSKNSEVQGHLDYLAKHLAVPNVLTKFKASRPMSNTDRYASAVLPFFCSLSLRGDIASRCHGAIMALVNSSALKPVGMRIKPARGERQPAAAELEKAYLAVPYTQWQVRQPPWQRQMRGQPAEKPSEGTEEAAPAAATRLPPSRCGPFPYLLCP